MDWSRARLTRLGDSVTPEAARETVSVRAHELGAT